MKNLYLILIISILICANNYSQSGHYWTQQYGTRSMLLSGSVIGGVEDLGSVYYNPARLSQIENPAFIISADVYEFNRIRINDAFGENQTSSRQDIRGVPSLAAGTFKVPFLPKHYFAWAILVRGSSDINFGYKNGVYDDVIEEYPGKEYFGADMSVSQTALDQWTGFNWSYPITDRLSVGASGFLALTNKSQALNIELRAYPDSSDAVRYDFKRSTSYEQYSLVGKIGAAYKTKNLILGLTVASPRLYLRGSGSYDYDESFTRNEITERDEILAYSSQSGLKPNYQSPWAIGLGITVPVKKNKIHLSSEWYSSMPKYTVLNPEDFEMQSHPGDTISYIILDELNSVINIGLGVELYLNEKVSGYLSASTDYSAVPSGVTGFSDNEDIAYNSTLAADFYHFGGGVVLHFKGADITLGATYTGAKQEFNRPVNFPEEKGDEIFGAGDTAEMEWDRMRVVFSFSLPFLKDVQEKMEDKLGL